MSLTSAQLTAALEGFGFKYHFEHLFPGDEDPDRFWYHDSGIIIWDNSYDFHPELDGLPTTENILVYNKVCDLLDLSSRKVIFPKDK